MSKSGPEASGTPTVEPEPRRAAPRGALALTRDRNFGPYILGKLIAHCSMWIESIAAAVFMFELSGGSAFMVGTVSIVQFAPQLLLAVWSGALNDRVDRRKLLMFGRTLSATGTAFLGVRLLVAGESGFGGPGVLLAGMLVVGVGVAFSVPGMQAIVPSLVPDADLEQALALNAAAPSMARTVGPAVGAGILALGGPGLAFAVGAAGHAVFVILLLFVRARPHERAGGRSSPWGGFRYLWSDRVSGWLVLGVAVLGFAADPVLTLAPSLAVHLGGDSALVGILASAFGAGALLSALGVSSLRNVLRLDTIGVAGFVAMVGGWLLVAVSSIVWLTVIGFGMAGSGFMGSTVALNTTLHRRVPDELRGRVMALWGVAFLGSRPIAAAMNGAIADLATIEIALFVTAGIAAVTALKVRAALSASQISGSAATTTRPRRSSPPRAGPGA